MQEKVLDEIMNLRASIDNFDTALIHILSERFRCTKAVGLLKASHSLPIRDFLREENQIERFRQLAVHCRLDPDFAEEFIKFLIKEVVQDHEEIFEKKKLEQVNLLNESQS
ncbi:chorismate mutase [Bartonella sp. CB189]|uniref:chorismate mutase n=1 Tax=Bartonella sp. CB189 TaxID=3112254 RepID=UPI002F9618F3